MLLCKAEHPCKVRCVRASVRATLDLTLIADLVNVNGYTLIVSSADARVAVAPIEAAFQQINVPLHVVDAVEALQTALAGARNAHSVQLWRDAGAALCRPDLYVAWTLEVALRRGPFAATEAAQLAAAACGLVGRDNEVTRGVVDILRCVLTKCA